MQQLDIEVPSGVVQLINVVQDTLGPEFEVTLAGGFLRDSYGGACIKDIDIVVAPVKGYTDTACVHDAVFEACIMDWFCMESIANGDYLEGMKARGVQGVIMGYSPNLGYESQLIVYEKPMSREEIAHDMDLNICQVVMGTDGLVWATQAFVEGFEFGTIVVLNGAADKREVERVSRMLAKYPLFTH